MIFTLFYFQHGLLLNAFNLILAIIHFCQSGQAPNGALFYASDNWVFISEAIVFHFLLHAFILHGLHRDTFLAYSFSRLYS